MLYYADRHTDTNYPGMTIARWDDLSVDPSALAISLSDLKPGVALRKRPLTLPPFQKRASIDTPYQLMPCLSEERLHKRAQCVIKKIQCIRNISTIKYKVLLYTQDSNIIEESVSHKILCISQNNNITEHKTYMYVHKKVKCCCTHKTARQRRI